MKNEPTPQPPMLWADPPSSRLTLTRLGPEPKGRPLPPSADRFPAPAARPQLAISGPALAALRWSAARSADECCFWGILEPDAAGLRLSEAVLAQHEGAPAYSVPDMDWYADLVAERHEQEGREPWQLACWIHTHPPGLAGPSSIDRATFERRFGRQRLAVMLIMTRDLRFYGELSACLPALPGLPPVRLTSPLRLEFEDPQAQAGADLGAQLEEEYAERVRPLHLARGETEPGGPWWRRPRRLGRLTGDPAGLGWPEAPADGPAEELGAGGWIEEDADDWPEDPAADADLDPAGPDEGELAEWELHDYLDEARAAHPGVLRAGAPPLGAHPLDLERLGRELGHPAMRVREAAALRRHLLELARGDAAAWEVATYE